MDTEALRLFVLAADKLNISAAGRELGIAPAVSSARLSKLEQTVGADLLHRSTRKVSLSLEGAEFLPYAREILAQQDAAMAALGKGATVPKGNLRFTAPSTFAQAYIAPILPEFLDRYPDITLDLHLSDSQFNLIEGSYDLALRNMVLEDSRLKARKLADDLRVLCASPSYLAKHGTPLHADDLNRHRLLAFRNAATRQLIGPDGQTHNYDPLAARTSLRIDDGQSQKIATLSGAGISINSIWSVSRELADGRLIHVLPGWVLQEQAALWLVYPKANVLSAKVRVFIDFLSDKIQGGKEWKTNWPNSENS